MFLAISLLIIVRFSKFKNSLEARNFLHLSNCSFGLTDPTLQRNLRICCGRPIIYRHVIISLESSWTTLYNPGGKNRVPLILDNGRPWLSGCLQPGTRSWILSYVREIWSKKIIIKICDIVIYSMFRTGLLVLTRPYPNNIPRLLQEVTRHVKETLYVHLAPGIPEQLNAHSRKVTLVISFLHFNLAHLFTLHGGLICITFCLSVVCMSLWNIYCAPHQRYRATLCTIDPRCAAPTGIVYHGAQGGPD